MTTNRVCRQGKAILKQESWFLSLILRASYPGAPCLCHTYTNKQRCRQTSTETQENTQQSLSSRSYGEENNNHAECCTENNLPLSVKKNNKEQNVVFRRRQRPMCTSLELRWSMWARSTTEDLSWSTHISILLKKKKRKKAYKRLCEPNYCKLI